MTSLPRPWLSFGLLLSGLALGGCAIAQAQRPGREAAIAPVPQPVATQSPAAPQPEPQQKNGQGDSDESAEMLLAQAPLGRPERPISSSNITSVKVFNLDSQCDRFEGEVVKLDQDGSLEEAVGLAIANSNNPDFAISSYRVNDGRFPQEVIVDLRLAPDSERAFTSLSVCEGQALFGSIRRTLVENGQFDVTQVQFTAAGTEIIR